MVVWTQTSVVTPVGHHRVRPLAGLPAGRNLGLGAVAAFLHPAGDGLADAGDALP
jgi:hypothetical protein